MGIRGGLVVLFLTLALSTLATESSPRYDAALGVVPRLSGGRGGSYAVADGDLVGDSIGEDEEMMMPSESARRSLAPRRRFISYSVLLANRVPCGQRGASYYSCGTKRNLNPYTRGCTVATHCARVTS